MGVILLDFDECGYSGVCRRQFLESIEVDSVGVVEGAKSQKIEQ